MPHRASRSRRDAGSPSSHARRAWLPLAVASLALVVILAPHRFGTAVPSATRSPNPADTALSPSPASIRAPAPSPTLKLTLLALPAWTSIPAPTATFNVKDYGAHADGVTDDRDHITAAAKAAVAGGGVVYFPAGTYRITGNMTTIAGAYYYAPTGVTLRESGGGVCPANGTTFDGFTFRSYGSSVGMRIGTQYSTTTVSDVTVKNCSFAAGSAEFTWSRIIVWRGHDCTIDNNSFTGTSGSGGNIQVIGGKRNSITDNTISGGTTSILFMWNLGNGGGLGSIIEDNVITGNTYSGASEEGISFDVMGNSSANGCFEYGAIAGVSGQTVTLSDLSFPNYVGYDIVFVDGSLRGRTRTITGQSGNSFTVSGSLTGAAAGDHVAIAACYKDNYIAYNTGTSAYSALLLYGNCFGNLVEHNTISGNNKIRVSSLNHLTPNASSVTLAGTTSARAPSGYNTIQYNSADQRVYLEYYGWGGSEASYISQGNNVIGNTTPLVNGLHQKAYLAGNSGTESLSDVTKAAAQFVYDEGL